MGVRAALAIVGRVGQVRRVGQVGQVGRVGLVGQVGQVGQERRVGGRAERAFVRCLFFANFSLILRSSFAHRSLNVQ